MDVEHVNLRSVFWPCSHCTIFADTLGSKMLLLGFCSSEKSFFCKWQTRAYMKRMTEYSECSESEGKRCRAHFLLQVFGEGYDVNHWELNDEVKLFSSVNQSCPTATSRTAARQVSLSNTNSWSSLKLMPIELVMPSNHLILCCPLLLLPSACFNLIYNVIKVYYMILNAVPWLHSSLLLIFYM